MLAGTQEWETQIKPVLLSLLVILFDSCGEGMDYIFCFLCYHNLGVVVSS